MTKPNRKTEPAKPSSVTNYDLKNVHVEVKEAPKFTAIHALAVAMGEQSKAYAELARALGAPMCSSMVHIGSMTGGREE
jgi:hypothetical protein